MHRRKNQTWLKRPRTGFPKKVWDMTIKHHGPLQSLEYNRAIGWVAVHLVAGIYRSIREVKIVYPRWWG